MIIKNYFFIKKYLTKNKIYGYILKPNGIAQIAQSVEQRTENPRVDGSIPSLGTIPYSI